MHLTNEFVEKLRLVELQSAIAKLDNRLNVLEVGAGSGWQARELDRLGFKVDAVDIPEGHYTGSRVWPVSDYDGSHLPFATGSFDLVFTSNVIEHVEFLAQMFREQLRVLKAGGYMIHIVPSATWRFWTSVTYYPDAVLRLGRRLLRSSDCVNESSAAGVRSRRKLIELLWAPTHGVRESPLSELWHFRRASWIRVFRGVPVEDVEYWPAGVFYSGHLLLGRALPIAVRKLLSRAIGSSCHVFMMRKSANE